MELEQAKPTSMKYQFAIAATSVFIMGCNMNPSKEARIQELETELQETVEKLKLIEGRVESLEEQQQEKKIKSFELEEG